jgi:hypothetical protein
MSLVRLAKGRYIWMKCVRQQLDGKRIEQKEQAVSHENMDSGWCI